MIYITGDCHSNFHKFNLDSFPEQKEMTKEDFMIICGDFGGIWDWKGESKHETYWMDWLEDRPFTTLFVDGNHENFERLSQYPEKEWNGGHVHEIRPSVLHLMRGYIFKIDGASIFAFGGARSHDIQGGVFESDDPKLKQKIYECEEGIVPMPYRINHRTWWKEEMPNRMEMDRGWEALEKAHYKVDFIVTHECPASTLALMSQGRYKPDELNQYLGQIKALTIYQRWFFGHYHIDKQIIDKEIVLYDQMVRIW